LGKKKKWKGNIRGSTLAARRNKRRGRGKRERYHEKALSIGKKRREKKRDNQ